MKHSHTPTPWEHQGTGLIYGEVPGDQDEAPLIADVIADCERSVFGCMTDCERANARFIVRACNAYDGFVATLKPALEALNTAPRFRTPAPTAIQSPRQSKPPSKTRRFSHDR